MQKFAVAKYFVLVYNGFTKGVDVLGNQLNEDKLISLRIRKLRKDEGWTQKELSERMNVTEKFISNLETAKKPLSLKMAKLYSEMFGSTLDYIIYGRVEKKIDISKTKILTQKKYCLENGTPMHLSDDGICPRCNCDITKELVSYCFSNTLINKCPSCGNGI